ncbi:MAG: hypothetical protein WDO56_06215 [Gammaproteobacteria bacterium]
MGSSLRLAALANLANLANLAGLASLASLAIVATSARAQNVDPREQAESIAAAASTVGPTAAPRFAEDTAQAPVQDSAPPLPDRPPVAAERCPPPPTSTVPRRRSPSVTRSRGVDAECNPLALPEPATDSQPGIEGIPDRWRVVSMLGAQRNRLDPYHGNNVLKADHPAFGDDWFVNLIGISDSVVEPRRFPVPAGNTATNQPGSNDTMGDGKQLVYSQTLVLEAVLYQGDTVFKPPDYEFRFTPAFNFSRVDTNENGLINQLATRGTSRNDTAFGVQALFVDKHLRNVSDRFDFDSLRVGIQPFISDFRGFLFQDSPVGVRLFGTRANNRYQYNVGVFRRIEKDSNSGLNDVTHGGALRDDDLAVANLYVQDWPVPGFTMQGTVVYNRNREGDETFTDGNSVIQRPSSLGLGRGSDYDVGYLGLNGDGHFGRWNLTASLYGAVGTVDRGLFVNRQEDIRAGFAATELSRDYSWARFRLSLAYATGDKDPFDDKAEGFDAIFENPQFAGADTSFYIRQPIPLIGAGRVALSGRNAFLNSLRTSKEAGASNFVNPGLILAGLGTDFDLTPTLRVSSNFNYLGFADTAVLEVVRQQGSIGRALGLDASFALTWRPLAIQNVVARLSVAALLPGSGYEKLFGDEVAYSVLGNIVLTY